MGLLRLADEDDGYLAQSMFVPPTMDDIGVVTTSSMLARMKIDENGTNNMDIERNS